MLQFNFVGRILGPRGMTAKQLEQETGCKIMVRGKGSMRDKKKVKFFIVYPYLINLYKCIFTLLYNIYIQYIYIQYNIDIVKFLKKNT